MSRINACFAALRAEGRKAMIPYIAAGDPDLPTTLGLMYALVESGADIIELGIPFSDPSSDGPVIQRAVERALSNNVGLKDVLSLVSDFRKTDNETPVVLMGYLNPIERMGYQNFTDAAVAAGIDGVLTVDLPPEEAHEFLPMLKKADIDSIFLVAPTTREERARNICEHSSGYVYYVSLKGVTGAGHLDSQAVADHLQQLRTYTDLPIGVGFGIKDTQSAVAVSAVADAVVVGSALVKRIAELEKGKSYSAEALLEQVSLIRDMRQAMDS